MDVTTERIVKLPPEQQAIRNKCFHPTGTFVEFPIEDVETSIPARFEKIVRMYPDHIAIKTKDKEITYDALNRCANRLARAVISKRGIGQEPIALYIEDEISLIVAHLASLKARKIVLRLDPSAAATRTDHIMEDSGAPFILTDARNAPMAHHWSRRGSKLFDVNDVASTLSDENLETFLSPDHYAFINYTSGSTGRAKGTLRSHRSWLHLSSSVDTACRISVHDRVAVFGRKPVTQAFRLLLTGSRQCIIEKEASFFRISDLLNQQGITIVISTPTAFRNFVVTLTGSSNFATIRLIRLGGEPLRVGDFDLYKAYFSPECLLVNSYSSQETGTISFYMCDRDTKILGNHLPVGFMVEGVKVSILDEWGNVAKPNQPGEIVVTSSFLSSGYWRNGVITTEHLLSRSDDEQGQFVYHTGDVGQLSADGCLVHLGRKDSRIKIRGFRVDIGEVEATLAEHPEVKLASVIAKEDSSQDARLIAYFVPRNTPGPSVRDLREYLGARLPPYMVPSVFVALAEFPLTGTGKVDRRALPDPGKSRPELDTPLIAPRTPIEQQLAQIWCEVLSLDQIGIDDNFFDLGGHSLAASRVISQVIQSLQLELPVKALFDSPTVADMAALIVQNQAKKASQQDLERLLSELEAMSETEAERIALITAKEKRADGNQ